MTDYLHEARLQEIKEAKPKNAAGVATCYLTELAKSGDTERAHSYADDVLIALLLRERKRFGGTVAAYHRVPKWYA